MQLSDIIIALRLRKPWAALDLGILIAKRYWLSYFFVWAVMAFPLLLLFSLSISQHQLWLVAIFVWWLKPLLERPILYMLSHHLFNRQISIKQVFKDIKTWLIPGWFWALTIRRFSPARSLYMPVLVLEKLKGNAYTQRVAVLGSKVGGKGLWLTCVLVHIEYFFLTSLLLLSNNLFSLGLFDQLANGENSLALTILSNIFSILSMGVMAPFFIACGFILYISRRIELEAWDIEICFRDMAKQHAVRKARLSCD